MMKNVKKILVPVDFSKNSEKILKDSIDVADNFGAKLTAVYIVQSFEDYSGFFVPHIPIDQFQNEMFEGAKKKMENFIEDTLGEVDACENYVTIGDVGEEIIKYAEKTDAGMIVMGTHGYKGLERVLFGSVAEQVVKNAPCPVLTINPYKRK
jgi:nucleotide-binding universal stress UspA family protein